MIGRLGDILEHRSLRRWERAAAEVADMDPASLRSLRGRARDLGRRLDRVLHAVEARLARPAPISRQLHTDWAWRPTLWTGPVRPAGLVALASGAEFGQVVKVFHDCPRNECSVRQVRLSGRAPYGVDVEVFHFGGSFLSLALDLPAAAIEGLSRRHLLRLELGIEAERPVSVFGRVNLRHGPNVEQITLGFDAGAGEVVEFDLASLALDEDRLSSGWVDVIFEAPQMNRIRIGDVTLSRRPRAEL
jgi:hypothetical protein